ncbi:MAG: threonine--tRNA ligase [Bacteroidota bacterium]
MPKDTITITLPDGAQRTFPAGTTSLAIAQTLRPQLASQVLVALVNEVPWDVTRPLYTDATLQLCTWEDEVGKQTFWHSSAHLMAEALEALYTSVQLGIGPPIAQGFYYDVDFGDQAFDASHLPAIEAKMQDLARQHNPYEIIPINKQAALAHFRATNSTYKLELLEGLQDGHITLYRQGQFTDLCKGPHIPHTGLIKAIKLLNIAGAYWRGNVKQKQLTRIYGITFPQEKALRTYLIWAAEAQKRSHQHIGKTLQLFTFSEKVGLGLPLWLPKGAILRDQLMQFLQRAQWRAGYQPVITPHIGHQDLYITSGHQAKYGEDAFQPIHTPHEREKFVLKPMNCPHHCEIYKQGTKSYRDLPIRLAEFGTVYRYEQHGELHGLMRTRCFTQDDAHIFCRPDQVKAELAGVIDLVLSTFHALDFTDYKVQLSFHDPKQPDKYIGNPADWQQAEQAMEQIVAEKNLPATRTLGEAAFYGPKIDFMVQDALGRSWQLGTVQLDYQLPERFALTYVGADNQKHRPVMIHRAPLGSLERFIAILLEHTSGHLPLWLAPHQVAILPISEKHATYADQIATRLIEQEIRVSIDHSDEKIGKKIRTVALSKVPYVAIIGAKEQEAQQVAVRKHGVGDIGSMSLDAFVQMLKTEITVRQTGFSPEAFQTQNIS